MSQTTPNSVMTWCMCTMEPLSPDTLGNGRHWNWCHGTTGGQGCPGMLPSSSWDVMYATGQKPSLCRRWGSSIDMIGELPDSKGYNAILVVVDHLSK